MFIFFSIFKISAAALILNDRLPCIAATYLGLIMTWKKRIMLETFGDEIF